VGWGNSCQKKDRTFEKEVKRGQSSLISSGEKRDALPALDSEEEVDLEEGEK